MYIIYIGLLQICVQMWAKSQSDVSREKISLLLAVCLSAIPPSAALYKYLLKYVTSLPIRTMYIQFRCSRGEFYVVIG